MKKIIYTTLLIVFGLFATLNLSAQKEDKMPYETLGYGTSIGSFSDFGVTVAYPIEKNFHIGGKIGFLYESSTATEGSSTYLIFAPYVKYFFPNIQYLNPFVQGSFLVNTYKRSVATSTGIDNTVKATETSLAIHAGAEWFPYNGVGVYAGVSFLRYTLDPSKLHIGIGGEGFIGIEWFIK